MFDHYSNSDVVISLKMYQDDKDTRSESILNKIEEVEDVLVELRLLAKTRAIEEKIHKKQLEKKQKEDHKNYLKAHNIIVHFKGSAEASTYNDYESFEKDLMLKTQVKGFEKLVFSKDSISMKMLSGNFMPIANIIKMNKK